MIFEVGKKQQYLKCRKIAKVACKSDLQNPDPFLQIFVILQTACNFLLLCPCSRSFYTKKLRSNCSNKSWTLQRINTSWRTILFSIEFLFTILMLLIWSCVFGLLQYFWNIILILGKFWIVEHFVTFGVQVWQMWVHLHLNFSSEEPLRQLPFANFNCSTIQHF